MLTAARSHLDAAAWSCTRTAASDGKMPSPDRPGRHTGGSGQHQDGSGQFLTAFSRTSIHNWPIYLYHRSVTKITS